MATAATLAYIAATVMQIIVLAIAAVVLFHCVGIVRDIRAMSARARKGADMLSDDLLELRAKVRSESRDLWSGVKMLVKGLMRKARLASRDED